MALTARNRVPSIDVLQVDYEYCNISYYAEGARNDLGEPSRILVKRAENVKCSIDPLANMPAYINHGGMNGIGTQGAVRNSTHYMIVKGDQAIFQGDLVTDYDNVTYDVLYVTEWQTHKEAFLRKIS